MTSSLFSSLFKQPIVAFTWRLRRKGRNASQEGQSDEATDVEIENTPTLLPAAPLRRSLTRVVIPRIHPHHQLAFPDQGWANIAYDPCSLLKSTSDALSLASRKFFDLPTAKKQKFQTQAGTEEGWSRVDGEKEFITIRTLQNTPLELREAATDFWAEAGTLLNSIMGGIEESLDLPAGSLTAFTRPCITLSEERTATMVRLFRYEGCEDQVPRIVAEAHRDLGILSLVIGDGPGLEVWDRRGRQWFSIEKAYPSPGASLMVGRQLERLTNGCYCAGSHLVRSYPERRNNSASPPSKKYRHSIVFVLRAHSIVTVNTSLLETAITGRFDKPLCDITAGELFRDIRAAHYNINAKVEERDEQRRKLGYDKP